MASKKDKDKDFDYSKKDKNPKGGMSKKGIERYNKATGSNLKPGVKGKADTPEKLRRKGSFLTRHYKGEFNMSKPLTDDKGNPTRHAQQAAAWGEPVPKNKKDQAKLAKKGENLLKKYDKKKNKKKD